MKALSREVTLPPRKKMTIEEISMPASTHDVAMYYNYKSTRHVLLKSQDKDNFTTT